MKPHYGVIYLPIGRRLFADYLPIICRLVADYLPIICRLFADFELNGFSLHVELINIYRILDVSYVCGFHFYFTFHLSICREIER
jgi:hypothetical protein